MEKEKDELGELAEALRRRIRLFEQMMAARPGMRTEIWWENNQGKYTGLALNRRASGWALFVCVADKPLEPRAPEINWIPLEDAPTSKRQLINSIRRGDFNPPRKITHE